MNKANRILPLENAKTQSVISTQPKTQMSHGGLIQSKDLRKQKMSKE